MKLMFLFVLLLLPPLSYSLEDNLAIELSKPRLNCLDVGYNASNKIVEIWDKNQDSVNVIVRFWEDNCGESEPIFRIKYLQNFAQNGYDINERKYDSTTIYMIFDYRNRAIAMRGDKGKRRSINYRYHSPIPVEFDSLTVVVAQRLLKNNNGSVLLLLYADKLDEAILKLKSDSSYLSNLYYREIEKIDDKWGVSLGLSGGYWMPSKNTRKIIGSKSVFGWYIGATKKRFTVDVSMSFRPFNAKNEYQVRYNDSIITTDHHFGAYIGLDLSYEFYRTKRIGLEGILGYGAMGWDAVDSDDNTKGIWSKNGAASVGIGWVLRYSEISNLRMEATYSFTNYSNNGGTGFDGNTVTLLMKWGWNGSAFKNSAYKYFAADL